MRIVRVVSGLMGLCLIALTSGLMVIGRGSAPEWLLYGMAGYPPDGGHLVWYDTQSGSLRRIRLGAGRVYGQSLGAGGLLQILERSRQCDPGCEWLYQLPAGSSHPRPIRKIDAASAVYISPDGRTIAYHNAAHELIVQDVYSGAGVSISSLFPPNARVSFGAFSPDSQWLAIGASLNNGTQADDTFRVRVDGTGLVNLSEAVVAWVVPEYWLTDDWLVVASESHDNLLRLHTETHEFIPLTDAYRDSVVQWSPAENVLLVEKDYADGRMKQLIALRPTDWVTLWQYDARDIRHNEVTPEWVLTFDDVQWVARRVDGSQSYVLPIPPDAPVYNMWGETPDGSALLLRWVSDTDQQELWRFEFATQTFERVWVVEGRPLFHGWIAHEQAGLMIHVDYVGDDFTPIATGYTLSADGRTVKKLAHAPTGGWLGQTLQSDKDFSRGGLLGLGVVLFGAYFVRRGLS